MGPSPSRNSVYECGICFPFFSSDVGIPKTEPSSGLWGQGKVTTAGQVEGRKDIDFQGDLTTGEKR